MSISIGELVATLDAQTAGFQRGIDQAAAKLDGFARELSSIGNKLTLGVSVPLAAAGAAAFKFGADAAESAAKMDAVFGPAAERMNGWIADLRAIIPATTAELQDLPGGSGCSAP